MSVPFQNLYTLRTSTKENSCWICSKFTPLILTSSSDKDWFYICRVHLSDKNFCKHVNPTVVSESPVRSQTSKTSNDAPPSSSNTSKANNSEKGKSADPVPSTSTQVSPAITQKKEPPQYQLDSKIFYMRESNYKQKQSQKRQKELMERLPTVPKKSLT
ncbi:hypothetical protein BKA69DRAFT_1048623 [Paraphysoderma sedebokerense]|nr:hypothetical protein BKA69DRAFT_1048623 [Paraphysoderma sedebokerense]